MAKKRRTKRFSAVEAVKTMAREHIGSPPPSRVVPDRKKKRKSGVKHKQKLEDLLDGSVTD
jgi:hypothetical protein